MNKEKSTIIISASSEQALLELSKEYFYSNSIAIDFVGNVISNSHGILNNYHIKTKISKGRKRFLLLVNSYPS